MGKKKVISAGLILWDIIDGIPSILLAKPGGPFFWRKKEKCFGIPKGQINDGENIFDGAVREFEEETGIIPKGPYELVPSVKYGSGKIVHAWSFRGKFNKSKFKSNSFTLEWPPKSGKIQTFEELVEPEMMDLDRAMKMVMRSQEGFIHSMREYFKEKNLL
jgi:predicted NUDIX family NTP pyrophosphohydrolase